MKKFYLFFALLLSFLGVAQVSAQDVNIPVKMSGGEWIEWNGSNATPWARSWYSTSTPRISICTKAGGMETTDIRGNKFNGANNMSAWGGAMEDLMFFSVYGSSDAPYEIMVEKGWYIKSVDFDFNCANNKNQTDGKISIVIGENEEVISTNISDTQHVAWENTGDTSNPDNEDEASYDIYAVTFTLHRIEGTYNFARTSNFVVTVAPVPDEVVALQELESITSEYGQYETAFTAGTKPGQYSADAIQAFLNALAEANNATGPDGEGLSAEQLRTLGQNVKDTYQAVLASKVPMTLADGYYRIKSGLEFYQTETNAETGLEETNYFDKYISAQKDGDTFKAVWNTPDEVETDCPSLFKVTNKDGFFDIQNMASDGRFNEDKPVTFNLDGENLMALDALATTEDNITYVNIRQSTTEANSGQIYLHCGGHNSGKGTSGNLTLWYSTYSNDTPAASEWIFEPVEEAKALAIIEAYGPIKNHEEMIRQYKEMKETSAANLKIAKDYVKLITDASQLSSPASDSDEGQHIEYLIDGNTSTFWHSDWHEAYEGTHYWQVELIDASATTVVAEYTRRAANTNHITQLTVRGTNNAEAEEIDCEELLVWDTPYTSNTESFTSEEFSTKGYKYLRFYITATNSNSVFSHLSEFQLISTVIPPKAQYRVMGDLATNLENVLKQQAEMEEDDITINEFNALKAVYDAFMAKFVNPAALRSKLAETKDVASLIKIGTAPGFWSEGSDAGSFSTLYNDAKDYDASGDYTPAQSESYIEQLSNEVSDIFASANKVRTDKWYRIRFAPEEDFNTYGWDKVAGNGNTKNIEELEVVVDEPLFGKYVTISWIEDDENSNPVASDVSAEEVGLNSKLFFDADEDINEASDLDLFRFIAVGDSAYMIQNKGTGLYIKAGNTGATVLSAHPSLFNTQAIGLGLNLIAAKSLKGDNQNYLHAQVSGNQLVTWSATTLGSRSALYIEEASNVAGNYEAPNAQFPIVFNTVNTYCFPVDVYPVSDEGQMYTVSGVDTENNKLTLNKIEKADGGRPFIYIFADDLEQFDEDLDAEMVPFKLGTEVKATEAQCHEPLKGIFYGSVTLDRGDIYATENQLKVNSVAKDAIMVTKIIVGANKAYISTEPGFNPAADLEIIYSEDEDGIQTALANVAKSGKVYTIDGRLVSKKANLNDLSKFGKGVYILNGTKVVVK